MKNRIILSAIIITIISIFSYAILRSDSIEKKYILNLSDLSGRIAKTLEKIEKRNPEKPVNIGVMKSFAVQTGKKNRQLAVIAIKDKKGNIKLASKNDDLIKSAQVFNSIIQEFSDGTLTVLPSHGYLIRYFNTEGTGKKKKKYYLFKESIKSYSLLLMYPYTPGKKIITRVVLEIILICLAIIILHALIYIRYNRTHSSDEPEETDKQSAWGREQGIKITDEDRMKLRNKSDSSFEMLNSFVRELFSSINTTHSPDSISLYLKNEENKLTKSFEYRENSYIRIDSVSFDTIDLENEVGNELKKGTALVLDKSSKIIIPVLFEETLLGLLMIIREKSFSGNETNELKENINNKTLEISNYIVMNNVMTDRESGLLSKTSFELKLNEISAHKERYGTEFSIILIDPVGSRKDIPREKINSLIKTISPAISEFTGADDRIFFYNSIIAVTLNDTSAEKAYETAEKIKKTLSKYRIKVKENSFFYIDPYISVSSSEGSQDIHSVKQNAEKNLHEALLESRGNIRTA